MKKISPLIPITNTAFMKHALNGAKRTIGGGILKFSARIRKEMHGSIHVASVEVLRGERPLASHILHCEKAIEVEL